MSRAWHLSLAILSFLASGTTGAQSHPRFVELGHAIDSFQGASGFTSVDVDGDGLEDATFTAAWGTGLGLFVLGATGEGGFDLKHSQLLPTSGGFGGLVSWSEDGASRIGYMEGSGTLHVYGGWPLTEARRVEINRSNLKILTGDTDADGIDELVMLTVKAVEIRSLSTGQLIRSFSVQPETHDMLLAQLDGDPALEIILSSSTSGEVVDGATGATDWKSEVAFGSPLAVGVLGANGLQRWAGVRSSGGGFDVFGSDPWATIWSQPTGYALWSIAMTVDEEGSDLLIGSQSHEVFVFSVDTQSALLRIPGPAAYLSVGVVDMDGDGIDEIIFAPNQTVYPHPNLIVADSRSGVTRWSFTSLDQTYASTAIGDIDGNGREELIAAARNDRPGNVVVSNFATGTPQWQSPGNPATPLPSIAVRSIELARRAGTPRKAIALAGIDPFSLEGPGRIVVLDPSTLEPTLQIDGTSRIGGTALYDYDGDGNDELLTAAVRSASYGVPTRLAIYSLSNGTMMWSSDPFEQGTLGFIDVFVLPGMSSGGDLFVAVTDTGLTAFSRASSAPLWSLPIDAADATYIANGEHGPEIVVVTQDSLLRFFDAATRAPLRSFQPELSMQSVQVLDGSLATLLVTSHQGLALIDGLSGTIRARSPPLGLFTAMPKMAISDQGGGAWHLAPASRFGVFRYRLELTEALFQDGFDSPH